MNSKLLRILLISALLVIFVAGCSSVTEVPAVATATETKQADSSNLERLSSQLQSVDDSIGTWRHLRAVSC